MRMTLELFWRIPSKKNSKQIIALPWRRPMLISSTAYQKREKETISYIKKIWFWKIEWPCDISYEFYRPDKRQCDIENKVSSIQDMLVKANILEDDSRKYIPSFCAKSMGVDPKNPRCVIYFNLL